MLCLLPMANYIHMSRVVVWHILLNLYIAIFYHFTYLCLILPSVLRLPASTLLTTNRGLPGKWFLLFLPDLEFQLQIYPSKKAKGSHCQAHSSFPAGHIFSAVTEAEEGSRVPSARGCAQHCEEPAAVSNQEEQIEKRLQKCARCGFRKRILCDMDDTHSTLCTRPHEN